VPNLVTRREYVGGAAQTTITAGINASDTSISITSSSGWPTGATGPWVVAIDPGLSTEEKVLIQSRSGTTLTVAGSGRGYDNTSAVSHSAAAVIYPVFPAIEANELNEHASKSTTVHGVTGAVVGTTDTQTLSGKTLTNPTINGATLTGTVTLPAATMSDFTNANHDHGDADDGGLLPTAAPTASAVGDSSVTGTATTYSRTDHKHAREAFGSVTAQTSFGAASADGAATTVARSDHTHGTPANTALAWGTLGYAEITAGSATFTTEADISGLSVTVTVGSSRRIKVTCGAMVSSDVATDLIRLRIKEGSTELCRLAREVARAGGNGQETVQKSVILTPSSGSHTYKITGERPVGTGNASVAAQTGDPAYILVEDIGAA